MVSPSRIVILEDQMTNTKCAKSFRARTNVVGLIARSQLWEFFNTVGRKQLVRFRACSR